MSGRESIPSILRIPFGFSHDGARMEQRIFIKIPINDFYQRLTSTIVIKDDSKTDNMISELAENFGSDAFYSSQVCYQNGQFFLSHKS
jgi:hypothetical protein